MTIVEARKYLTHDEISQVTEKALETGPFQIRNIRKIGSRTEVNVRFPETDREKIIVLDKTPMAVL